MDAFIIVHSSPSIGEADCYTATDFRPAFVVGDFKEALNNCKQSIIDTIIEWVAPEELIGYDEDTRREKEGLYRKLNDKSIDLDERLRLARDEAEANDEIFLIVYHDEHKGQVF
jgi:hypothetical protein